jgi:hypothetical protein
MSRHLASLIVIFFVAALPPTLIHISRSDLQSPNVHLAAFALLIHPPIPESVTSFIDFGWGLLMSSAIPLVALVALEGNPPLDPAVFAFAMRRVPAQLGFMLTLFGLMIPVVLIMVVLCAGAIPVAQGLVHVSGVAGNASSSLLWFGLTLLLAILAFPVIVVSGVALTEIALNGRGPVDAVRTAVATLRQPHVRLQFAQLTVWAFYVFLLLQLARAVAFEAAIAFKLSLLAFILPLVLNLPIDIFATLVYVGYWVGVISAKRSKQAKTATVWQGSRPIVVQLIACSIALYTMVHPHYGLSWYPDARRSTLYATLAECERSVRAAAATVPGFPTTCSSTYAVQLGW